MKNNLSYINLPGIESWSSCHLPNPIFWNSHVDGSCHFCTSFRIFIHLTYYYKVSVKPLNTKVNHINKFPPVVLNELGGVYHPDRQ